MIECRVCGANCDPGDLRQGVCDECRGAEVEFKKIKAVTDRRRQQAFENMERSGVKWQGCVS